MILVIVGNATQSFRRLLYSVDKLAGQGLFGDEIVVIQSGNDRAFRPMYCKQVDFIHPDEFAQIMKDCSLVICQGGAGTLYHAFNARKVPVVMPRRKQYGELLDDNQIYLVEALASEGRIIPAYEPEELPVAIAAARSRSTQPVPPAPSRMLALVSQAIEEFVEK